MLHKRFGCAWFNQAYAGQFRAFPPPRVCIESYLRNVQSLAERWGSQLATRTIQQRINKTTLNIQVEGKDIFYIIEGVQALT